MRETYVLSHVTLVMSELVLNLTLSLTLMLLLHAAPKVQCLRHHAR